MTDLVWRGLSFRSLDVDQRTCDFIASTDAIDSYDEIVEQVWKLDRFKANPVALYGHNSRELPIGQCTRCEVVRGALECTIKFLPAEANPLAEQVWRCVQERALRAVSVGFMPGTVRYEKRDGRDVYVLSDNELHEISVVPIPANPEALAKMRERARTQFQGVDQRRAESIMKTVEELMALVAQREAEIRTHEKTLHDFKEAAEAAKTKIAALEAQTVRLSTERDAALTETATLKDKVIAQEVDALVGVKIEPAERDLFARLAKSDRPLFDAMITQRAPKPTLKKIVGPDQSEGERAAEPGGDDGGVPELVAEAEKRAAAYA